MIRHAQLLAAIALAGALAGPIAAQTAGPEDLRALIFYLEQNDRESVQAELRRLRVRYPDWEPPEDLSTLLDDGGDRAGADEEPIWAAIERGDFEQARTLIDSTREAFPEWTPRTEMLELLELNEAQAAFDAAVTAGRAEEAISIYRRTPAILRCDRINNAWRVAHMHRALDQPDSAVATYRGVIGSCQTRDVIWPTLEKANEIATRNQLDALFAEARTALPAQTEELAALRDRLMAGRGADGTETDQQAAPAQPEATAPDPPQDASPAPRADGADAPEEEAPRTQGASILDSLPVRGDSRLAEVRRAKEAGAWAQCILRSNAPRSVEVLYERSWCAYELSRPMEALAGFRVAAGSGLDATVRRDARFGMALSYLGMQMTEEAARVAAATEFTRDQRIEVEATILDQRGVRAFRLEQFEQAISFLDALEELDGGLRRDLEIMRAYAYLNSGQRRRAFDEFQRLHDQLATAETRAGLNASRP